MYFKVDQIKLRHYLNYRTMNYVKKWILRFKLHQNPLVYNLNQGMAFTFCVNLKQKVRFGLNFQKSKDSMSKNFNLI